MTHVTNCLESKIPQGTIVEVMMGCGNKLVKPALSSNQSLTGYMINKIFGTKTMYLRPALDLGHIKVESSDEDSDVANRGSKTCRPFNQLPKTMPTVGLPKQTSTKRKTEQDKQSNPTGSEVLYSSYIELLETDDDNDEALANLCREEEDNVTRAIAASLEHTNVEEENVNDLLRQHQVTCLAQIGVNEIIIRRARLLQTAFAAIQSKTFNCCEEITVKFSGEDGSDAGGPRREFFRLAMQQMSRSIGLFEGKEGRMMFCHNIKSLEENKFLLAGRLVGISVTQGGPGFCCLHPIVYKLISGLPCDLTTFQIYDIVDPDLVIVIEQLKSVASDEELQTFIVNNGDYMAMMGYPAIYSAKLEDKSFIITIILKYFLLYRVTAEINQFTQGIQDVRGLWNTIKQYPKQFEILFTANSSPISRAQMKDLTQIQWSEQGSNKKNQEDATIYCWEVFLKAVEDGNVNSTINNTSVQMRLEDVLQFITGADRVPPLGFDKKIVISFYDQEDGTTRLPYASTCALQLSLPRGHENESSFGELMKRAIFESCGFGKA